MTLQRVLYLNALSTTTCATAVLAARRALYPLFGLSTPTVLDLLAVGSLACAGALVVAARRQPIDRRAVTAFAIVDALWVAASALVLLLFWQTLAPVARLLVVAVALVVGRFARLQFQAAAALRRGSTEAG